MRRRPFANETEATLRICGKRGELADGMLRNNGSPACRDVVAGEMVIYYGSCAIIGCGRGANHETDYDWRELHCLAARLSLP